jgi:hypothetical protein
MTATTAKLAILFSLIFIYKHTFRLSLLEIIPQKETFFNTYQKSIKNIKKVLKKRQRVSVIPTHISCHKTLSSYGFLG